MDMTKLNGIINSFVMKYYPAIFVNIGTDNLNRQLILNFHNTEDKHKIIGKVYCKFSAVVRPKTLCDNVDFYIYFEKAEIDETLTGELKTAMETIVKELNF